MRGVGVGGMEGKREMEEEGVKEGERVMKKGERVGKREMGSMKGGDPGGRGERGGSGRLQFRYWGFGALGDILKIVARVLRR